MVINKKAKVKVGTRSLKWYLKRGYVANSGDIIEVLIEDLTEYSSALVEVECQLCKSKKEKKFFDYKNCIEKSLDGKYYCKICSHENAKNTNRIKYGYISPLLNPKIKEKTKKRMIEKYGVDNISKVDFIKEDRSILMKNNTIEYNKIIKEKYGCNVSKLEWVKEKKKNTMIKNWGVENPSQNIFLFEKSQISGKKLKKHVCGLFYRGSYEKDFLDYCYINNIDIQKGISIKYNFGGKNRIYHSDFLIPPIKLIIEVKSKYYYELYEEINIVKRDETIKTGYNHLFIIDKDYTQFSEILKI